MERLIMLISLSALLYFLLKKLKKLKLNFYVFIIGSLGVFTLAMVFFMDPLNRGLSLVVTQIMNGIAHVIGGFEVYAKNALILIDTKDGMLSMLINYECSGTIELLVYSSLTLVFPFINHRRKIGSLVIGNLYILFSNIVRLLAIIFIVKSFGVSWYNVAHTVIGRIIFFVLMVYLYYKVFTKNQLRNQKIGAIR